MSVVTLALAKEWLQINHSQQDNAIQLMIDGAESFLAEFLNVIFASDDFEEDLDSELANDFQSASAFGLTSRLGNGAPFLVPTKRPVTEVETVLDLQNDEAVMTFVVQGDLIAYADENGNFLGAWPPGLKRYRVSYTAGYETLPPAIKQAVCMLVARMYAARDGQTGMAATGSALAYGGLMDSALIKMVQPFSRKRMADV